MIGGTSDDQSHEQRPGDSRKGYKNRQKGKIDKVRDALYGNTATTRTKAAPSFNSQERDMYGEHEMLPPKGSSATRVLPCLHYIIMQLQTLGNSRGQRTVDSIIMYQNYGVPTKAHVINMEDKQIVFPEDYDSDIIIINDDYNRNNMIDEGRVESLKHYEETTTEVRYEYLDANEFFWMTTDWSPCEAPCGQKGHQIRGAVCQRKRDNDTRIATAAECLSRGKEPPNEVQDCSVSCARWRTAPWSLPRCATSGAAISHRRVECVSDNGTVVDNSICEAATKPEKMRREARPCRAAWAVGAWSKCVGPCSSLGRQHRVLQCVWRMPGTRRRARERSAGAACEGLARPPVTRACQVHACVNKDGVCRDSSRFCENVRAMNMCALKRYKEQCCKTCSD